MCIPTSYLLILHHPLDALLRHQAVDVVQRHIVMVTLPDDLDELVLELVIGDRDADLSGAAAGSGSGVDDMEF